MIRRRTAHVVSTGLASLQSSNRGERKLLNLFYSDDEVRRVSFDAGFDLGWKITAVETPRRRAPYKYVVIAGSPSWSEYWAEFLSALPKDREMIVVDRPGFGTSGPKTPVTDIRLQAAALSPLLFKAPFGQKIILVGHSYGAAIATLMAANHPGKVAGLVLLSGYFGEFGQTSKFLVGLGSKVMRLIPRDLRHAIMEVTGQAQQLPHMKEALSRLRVPVHVIHGDKDDYAPIEAAENMVKAVRTKRPVRFERVEGGDHFLHDAKPRALLEALERCIPPKRSLFDKPKPKDEAANAA